MLEAIYGAYVLDASHTPEGRAGELAQGALFLAELVAAHLHQHAEALDLLALMRLCEARRSAKHDAAGAFVPLDQQDTSRWDAGLMAAANEHLAQAAQLRAPGPFQLEAAIQAAHHHRAYSGHTPWADIVQLYEQLLACAAWTPSAPPTCFRTSLGGRRARTSCKRWATTTTPRKPMAARWP